MSIPPGIVCTSEQYNRSLADAGLHCLTRGQSIGLTVTAESGLISLVAVLGVFILIIRNGFRHVRRTGKWYLVQEPMDVFMLSLFVADLIQAIGAVMDVHWVHNGKVEVGSFCTAQGVVQQLGETSVAITTLMITIFTWVGVWCRKGLGATSLATFLIALVWLFVALLVGIGNATHRGRHDLYESPTPYWCWIGQGYLGLRIGGEYIWLWLTLGVSAAAYLTLFLWARGNITVSERAWWRCTVHRSSADAADRGRRRNSYAMIAYPACYCVLILPLSVVRWIGFEHPSAGAIPSAATFAVISVYGLSGALNVALLLNTRPNSVLFGDGGVQSPEGRAPSPVGTYRGGEDESASDFRARSRGSHDSSLQLGRLPSASDDGGWDLPRTKGVVHRHQEDDRHQAQDDDSTMNENLSV
ncbi:hypothetical protein B0H17DRAFT_1059942 [Mycena rosella]|uniref:Glucose receptor Git3 N-terminal domain-containing protein n=1 Tax=Mycena rosella TaxID=1033263 RepID=A0AAD7GG65_MYCRO|nr:hypothetical protein B0H17DRAFT_1059942 [Mycena rosella]